MPLQLRTAGAIARSLIGLGVVVLIFYFLGRGLVSNWGNLKSEEIDVQPALLLLSGLLLAGDVLLRSVIWADLLGYYTGQERPPLRRLAKVFVYSWIGRYLPGKVAYVVGRFYLGRSVGVPSPALVGSIAYENVLLLVAALALASLTLVPSLAAESESVLPYLALPVLAVGVMVALQPPVLRRGLHFVLRLLGREPLEADWLLPPRRMGKVIALYFAVFCLSGAGFYLIIVSLTSYSPRYLPLAVGIYTLAGVLGMFAIFAPAGIGVREGFMVGLLQFTMPLEVAILVSLVARAWATIVDLLLVVGCFVYDYVSGDRILGAALRGAQGAEVGGGPSEAFEH
jgi:uncharacterized membrane protein YbhN (UPF0104 family)